MDLFGGQPNYDTLGVDRLLRTSFHGGAETGDHRADGLREMATDNHTRPGQGRAVAGRGYPGFFKGRETEYAGGAVYLGPAGNLVRARGGFELSSRYRF